MKKKIKVDIKNNLWFGGWEITGYYFGYPSCCIENFVTEDILVRVNELKSRKFRKLKGTGYRPCTQCNEIYTEEELVVRINSKRRLARPFDNTMSKKDSLRASRLGVKILNNPEKYPDVPQFILDKLHDDLKRYRQTRT